MVVVVAIALGQGSGIWCRAGQGGGFSSWLQAGMQHSPMGKPGPAGGGYLVRGMLRAKEGGGG